ncbi:UTP3 small subunit processome component Sas10 isoform X1 [Lycorma delicatula]|uniref:UTP3 small subunit processome component Sas10 isoform X1 n=1 Tax=Lycorma delicatula TaxID=130591 RepID=UPI003F515756
MDKRNKFDPDADLEEEIDEYEPSDSDDDYDDNEKLLLEKARKGKGLQDDCDDDDDYDNESEEDVLGIYSSDEEDKGKKNGDMKNMDSDIEGMEDDEKIPDSKAWGKRKKDYYYTDYVDQDYGGFVREEEEQVALMEEKEARTLQSRLAAQLDDIDLSLGLISKDKKDVQIEGGVGLSGDDEDDVKTDLSKLSKREKLALFQNESPEFFGLVNDFKERLTFVKEKFPILKLIRSNNVSSKLPCSKFLELKTHLTLNYCTNLAFYLILKKKRIRVKDHPVTERLLKYRTLLQQLDSLESSEYLEHLNDIVQKLDKEKNLNLFNDSEDKKVCRNKKKLKLLTGKENDKKKKEKDMTKFDNVDPNEVKTEENIKSEDENSDLFNDDYSDDDDINDEPPNKKLKSANETKYNKFEVEDSKRAITYEMAKNKGLTPYRKKEQRNPRVKHRNKYRKALIRRKGQVREVQKEVSKYGGEIFGIKASVIKSRKFKKF